MLHQDDWFAYDESLQEYVALIERDPSTKFAFSAAVARDISGRLLFQHSPTDRQIQELRRDPRCLLQANFVGPPSATIYRRSGKFQFDTNLKWLVDVDAYVRILSEGGRFQYSSRPLINVTAGAAHQVTREVQGNPILQYVENAYVYRAFCFTGLERDRMSVV